MSNENVIKAFMKGESAKSSNGNLYVSWDGKRLINYSTCIAQKLSNGRYIVNSTKYSMSTSKIQCYVRYHIGKYREVFNVPINTLYLK